MAGKTRRRISTGHLMSLIVAMYVMNFVVMFAYVNILTGEKSSIVSILSTSAKNENTADFYCPKLTETNPAQEKGNHHPTILWGIPTYDGPDEAGRRMAIRDSYLSFFRRSETPNRICSLANFTCLEPSARAECQIIYTFFMGANPNAPTERLENFDDFRSMTTSRPVINGQVEPDITYLDIQENQFDGKMTTWLHFGATVAKEFGTIEYVAKVDSDTLVLIPNFLDYMKQNLPPYGTERVYVGRANTKMDCDMNLKNHDHACPLPLVGDIYMAGDLNMMTHDLAEYTTSPLCPRQNVTISTHEDVSIGNYVFTHPLPVTSVIVPRSKLLLSPLWTMDKEPVDLRASPENFTNFLWCHSKRDKNFAYFKTLHNYQKFWRRFSRYRRNATRFSVV